MRGDSDEQLDKLLHIEDHQIEDSSILINFNRQTYICWFIGNVACIIFILKIRTIYEVVSNLDMGKF